MSMMEIRKLLLQSPLNCSDSPTEISNEQSQVQLGRRLTRYFCQPKMVTLSTVIVVLTLFLSSVFVNEQAASSSTTTVVVERFFSTLQVCSTVEINSTSNSSSKCAVTRSYCSKLARAELLPKGIVAGTSDLQMRSLTPEDEDMVKKNMPKNLLAMAVGIKQKEGVNRIVQKFPLSNFTIMLFHYDGIADQWNDLPWYNQSIHIVALRQTKWWYAKRFMHPDIVEQYNYIFLWDEDLGVENFNASRYVQIMQEDGMEISQPALDPASNIHHGITIRKLDSRSHKRFFKTQGTTGCTKERDGPPCTGWVEVMAPVFSKAAWRCTWHMIQNDLVHGWGIDFKVGYCAQGIRSQKVGIIDAEYVLHQGIPSLGGPRFNRVCSSTIILPNLFNVRMRSVIEMKEFLRRWRNAVKTDPDWIDPYQTFNESSPGFHEDARY
ncbi:unnamed protein product [Sphagnum balticum]